MQPPPWSAGLAARSVWSSAASLVRRCEGHACRGLDQQSRLSSFAAIQLSSFPLAPFPAHPFPDVLCAIQQLDAVCFTCDRWATVSDCRSCAQGWRPDSCGNSERLFRSSSLPIPVETDNNRGPVIPVSERSFADRSGLVEIHVTLATSGEDLRRQLDGVRRQVRINAAAVEVGGELQLQAALC